MDDGFGDVIDVHAGFDGDGSVCLQDAGGHGLDEGMGCMPGAASLSCRRQACVENGQFELRFDNGT